MPRVPLTPAGVRLKTQELYALSQNDLDIQAKRIYSDFTDWMDEHFQLTASESQFIASINAPFSGYLAIEISAAVQSRLPITLEEPYPPQDPVGSKRVDLRRSSQRIYREGQSSETVGALFIAIDYVAA